MNRHHTTCVSVTGETPGSMLAALESSLEMSEYAELRLDFLSRDQVGSLMELAAPYMNRTVCTLRPAAEGGRFGGAESERIRLLEEISGYGPYMLDVELAAIQDNHGLLDRLGADILVSWHDFEGTPEPDELRRRLEAMRQYSSNVKMAVMARDTRDVATVLGLYAFKGDATLVAFAMGKAGRFSRLCSLYLGSPFTYVSLGTAVAPGQYSLEEIKKIPYLGPP